MRLGLFGGTFDPIHLGHLILAEQCREACGLDRVWFVVAGAPPHKPGDRTPVAAPPGDGPDRHRGPPGVRGLRARGAAGPARITASRRSRRSTRERPEDDLFFLIGADSLADLPGWRQPERIARLATIVVVNRPGIDDGPDAALARLRPGPGRSGSVTIPPIGIASNDLRRRAGRRPEHPLPGPRGVEAYIEAHGLYSEQANT